MKKKRAGSKALALAAAINSSLKSEVVGLASDSRFTIQRVPTGSLTIDRITGGGFPRGRHVELFGDYSAGKSTIAYMTMVLAQQRGELCALVDQEKVFEEARFRALGGDPDELVIARPRTAEEVIRVLMLFAGAATPEEGEDELPRASIVTVDSVASLLPREEFEKDPVEGDDRTASRARMMSRALRRTTAVNTDTLFIWTNQLIDQVGGYGGATTPGGRALKFYASIRIHMRKAEKRKLPRKRAKQGKLVQTDTVVGQWVVVRAEKQKTAQPELESMFLFDYERSRIDPEAEIIQLGLEDGLIVRSGNTFTYEDSDGDTWSGVESRFRKLLQENDDMREELVWAITENSRLQAVEGEEETDG